MNRFAIIVCAYNNLEYSKACVESIRKCTETNKYKIFFVNDGSEDGTGKWADGQSRTNDFIVFNLETNSGYIAAANFAVHNVMKYYKEYDYLFLLNNDVVINSWWISEAEKLLKDDSVAIIGAYGHKSIAGKEFSFISGSRMIVKTNIIRELGSFYDSQFRFGYWEDVDFSLRVQHLGYKIKKFELPSIHARGKTFNQHPEKKRYASENRKIVEARMRSGVYGKY